MKTTHDFQSYDATITYTPKGLQLTQYPPTLSGCIENSASLSVASYIVPLAKYNG